MARSLLVATLLVLTLLAGATQGHECFHDKLKAMQDKGPEVIHVDYPDQSFVRDNRQFEAQASATNATAAATTTAAPAPNTPQNMRVTVVWDPEGTGHCASTSSTVSTYTGSTVQCSTDDVLSAIKKDYVRNTLMVKAKEWIQSALNVIRVSGNLVVSGSSSCGNKPGVAIPSSDSSTGQADTDFLIYVTAVPMADSASATVAWALACREDSNGRPLVGHVNWVPSKLTNAEKGNAVAQAEDVATGIHEIMHALGFAAPFFGSKGYLKSDSSGYSSGGTSSSSSSTLGKTLTKIVSPRVVAKAQEHFGCTTLDGLEIEDQGGAGTAGSHWEKRVMYQDVMNGVGSNVASFISQITLAFFEDTGHYTANYGTADPGMTWGHKKGCDFLSTKCIVGGKASYDEFCTETKQSVRKCTHDRLGMGMCDVANYQSALPDNMQYFADNTQGSQVSVTDYCPTVIPFSNTKCIDSANVDSQDIYGNDYTSSSRCFDSTLIELAYSTPDSGTRCFITSCTSAGNIEISIEGKIAKCPTDGTAGVADDSDLSVTFKGSINCPAASTICLSSDFAPPTPAPPTPAPTPLPPGETYAPTRIPPTPPPTLAADCASRATCANNNNVAALMPACRELADDVVNCFGTNCDSEMIEWLTINGFANKCKDKVKFKDECQEGNQGVTDICFLIEGGAGDKYSLVAATLVSVVLALLAAF